ncbi:MAG TPA: type II toxin-antitoxin system PemK/MazF family toxin [Thermoanaerobaculia bacterium]
MRRGDLYRVKHPSALDPRRFRVFVVVSRQLLVNSTFSSVICAPIYTRRDGLHSQVLVGIEQGLKHDSSIHCDELVSLQKSVLTDYVGALPPEKILELDRALAFALDLRAPWPN